MPLSKQKVLFLLKAYQLQNKGSTLTIQVYEEPKLFMVMNQIKVLAEEGDLVDLKKEEVDKMVKCASTLEKQVTQLKHVIIKNGHPLNFGIW